MNKDLLFDLGSQTAKNGFRNERDVVKKFNNWQNDDEAKCWLKIMGYNIEKIKKVEAVQISGYKTDVQVEIKIDLTDAVCFENLQVKLVSNLKGFNQIDKRWIDSYVRLWNMPKKVADLFKYYTGEIAPYKDLTRDNRRMFIDELALKERNLILEFLETKKTLIVTDILKGRGGIPPEWMLVIQKLTVNSKWVLKPMNFVLNYYGNGDIKITPRGSIKIGRITMQRKGGDRGRNTAKMLQFKINPAELFES